MEPIGKGSYGQIYRSGTQAIKVQSAWLSDGSDQILNPPAWLELDLLRQLQAPIVRSYYQSFKTDPWFKTDRCAGATLGWQRSDMWAPQAPTHDHTYISLELMTGNLLQLLRRIGTRQRRDLNQRLMTDVVTGLNQLWSQGLIHGDVSITNILYVDTQQGVEFRLADLGTCLPRGACVSGERVTVWYRPPELLHPLAVQHGGLIDTWVDIWSLGMILYTWWTGETPITGTNARMVRNQLQSFRVGPSLRFPNENLNATQRAILNRLLQWNPAQRPTPRELFRLCEIPIPSTDPRPALQVRRTLTDDEDTLLATELIDLPWAYSDLAVRTQAREILSRQPHLIGELPRKRRLLAAVVWSLMYQARKPTLAWLIEVIGPHYPAGSVQAYLTSDLKELFRSVNVWHSSSRRLIAQARIDWWRAQHP